MLWHGRLTVELWLMAAGRQKKICGMEGENAVAYGRLLSPAHLIWGSVIYAPSPTLQGQFIKEKLDL